MYSVAIPLQCQCPNVSLVTGGILHPKGTHEERMNETEHQCTVDQENNSI